MNRPEARCRTGSDNFQCSLEALLLFFHRIWVNLEGINMPDRCDRTGFNISVLVGSLPSNTKRSICSVSIFFLSFRVRLSVFSRGLSFFLYRFVVGGVIFVRR